jgi:hypothetical protein
MCSANCKFFETDENNQSKRTIEYCLLVGLETLCRGDSGTCERLETRRDSALQCISHSLGFSL